MSAFKVSVIKRKRTDQVKNTFHENDDFKEPSQKRRKVASELDDRSQCPTEKIVDPLFERQRIIVHSYIRNVINSCHFNQNFPKDLMEICLSFCLEEQECLFPSIIDSDDLVSSSDGVSQIAPEWNSVSYSPIAQNNEDSPFPWIQSP